LQLKNGADSDLNEKIKNRFNHVEEVFNKALDEVQDALGDIYAESGKLLDAGDAFADQFGDKVRALASEIKRPEIVNNQTIDMYIETLDNFQGEILRYGSRLVRKIGFKYKFSITRVENNRRRIFKLTKELKESFSRYRKELKNQEKAEKMARRLSSLETEETANKKALKKVNDEIRKLKNAINEYEERMQALRQEKDLREAKEFREAETSFEERVKENLRHLEKPVLKSLKLVERGVIDKDQNKIGELSRLIKDPKGALLKTGNTSTIEAALTFLQGLLKDRKLDLKASRNKKALEVISNLLTENKIDEYGKKFSEYQDEKRRKLESTATLEKESKLNQVKKDYRQKKDRFKKLLKEKERIENELTISKEKEAEYNLRLKELI